MQKTNPNSKLAELVSESSVTMKYEPGQASDQ